MGLSMMGIEQGRGKGCIRLGMEMGLMMGLEDKDMSGIETGPRTRTRL